MGPRTETYTGGGHPARNTQARGQARTVSGEGAFSECIPVKNGCKEKKLPDCFVLQVDGILLSDHTGVEEPRHNRERTLSSPGASATRPPGTVALGGRGPSASRASEFYVMLESRVMFNLASTCWRLIQILLNVVIKQNLPLVRSGHRPAVCTLWLDTSGPNSSGPCQ